MSSPAITRNMPPSRRHSLVLLAVLIFSSLSPLAIPSSAEDGAVASEPTEQQLYADIDDFIALEGKPYTFFEDGEPVYSATQFFKQGWIDAGRPGVDDFENWEPENNARSSARACTRYNVGDSVTIPAGGGSVSATVEKTTNTAAFIVQDGRTLSSTILNNWAQTWDQTIYPTVTTYFGKDYGDGNGPAPPDVDNNCQIEVAIIDIDGQYQTGGYFAPGLASYREIVFVDVADAPLSWSKVILAHEFQHLLHNAVDNAENIWIDEGNADMAAFLCFGASSTLTGHSNAWTSASSTSVRWWNQRIADYGGGFLFMLYLADHLGGGPAIRTLVSDQATGAAGIENLGRSPPGGTAGLLGTTFEDMFANFTIAATLDSAQGIYGLSNIGLTDLCSGGAFCKIQPADSNSDWSGPWTSTGNAIEGWGVRVFKLTPGSSAPAPLTFRVTADVTGMDGRVMSRSSTDGIYNVQKIPFNGMVGNGLVPGFGNITDEVWIITWYASAIGDCDYTSCGPTYPSGVVDVEAARITSPATLTLNNSMTSDRDGDGKIDTAQYEFDILSNAFFEDLDVEIEVVNGAGDVVDSIQTRVSAGGGQPVSTSVWFTPAITDQYSFHFTMSDLLGDVVDEDWSTSTPLENMRPVVNGSISQNSTLTWENIQFIGDGFDPWGVSLENNTLPHSDPPVAYLWTYGDGTTSALKSPVRNYRLVGDYIVTLQVQDQGGFWSELDSYNLTVFDDTLPVPIITINGQLIGSQIVVETYQQVLFSAGQTSDNVPIDHLIFNWDWGDGTMEGGIGDYSAHHEWTEGENNGLNHTMILTVNDSINEASFILNVIVMNRLPRVIFDETLFVDTLTPIQMPDVFVDDDGAMISIDWQFIGGVNLSLTGVNRDSDFNDVTSSAWNPWASWRDPGLKQIIVTGMDDDNGISVIQLEVVVRNQLPIADISVRQAATEGSPSVDFRQVDAQVETTYTFDGRASFDPDGSQADSSILSFNWTFSDGFTSDQAQAPHNFSEPGTHTVTLIVTDENGEESTPRVIVVRVENPVPIIELRVLEAWQDGELVTSTTPRPDGWTPENFSRSFDDAGNIHVATGTLLWFDTTGTRDGDSKFNTKVTPFDIGDADWNGLVEYAWDFGDATPPSKESHPWHSYSEPGIYTISLTVRDAFQTGDTSTERLTIHVNQQPLVDGILADENPTEGEVSIFEVNMSDPEHEDNVIIWRDDDVNDGADDDKSTLISAAPVVWWNFGDSPEGEDGWIQTPAEDGRFSHVYNESGRYVVRVRVCDSMGVCTTDYQEIEVLRAPEEGASLADFEWQDWRAWLAQAGGESAFVLGLISAVLVLGWLVMRTPGIEEEEEAEEASKAYDVETVKVEGGFIGMDQHEAPPSPKILSKDERRSKKSGYVRPVRSRRR